MSIELTNEMFMQKEYTQQPKINWNELFVSKIEANTEKMLRAVVDFNDPLYLKGVPMHKYLKGVGSAVCVNTAETIKAGGFCPFCDYVRVNLNRVYDIMQPLLTELGYTTKTLKELEAAVVDVVRTKPAGWEKIKELQTEAKKYDMVKASPKFILPVIDRSSPGKIKLFEHSTSIQKAIGVIAKNKNITTADLRIENQAKAPVWYSVTREDPADFSEQEKELIARELPIIQKTMDNLYGEKASSLETAATKFAKFSDAVNGTTAQSAPQSVNPDLSASNFTVQPQ